jgi:hypothetical protein
VKDGRGKPQFKKTKRKAQEKPRDKVQALLYILRVNLCNLWLTQKNLLKDLDYKSFSFNLAKQISYKQKQTRYGRAINFGETKERKNE